MHLHKLDFFALYWEFLAYDVKQMEFFLNLIILKDFLSKFNPETSLIISTPFLIPFSLHMIF